MTTPRVLPAVPAVPPRTSPRLALAMAILALLTVFVLGGCVTRTIANGGLEARPAPADSQATGNMVVSPAARADGQRILRFANDGATADRAALRHQADARMTATCGDAWRVSAEGSSATGGVVSQTGAHAEDAPSPYWYIQFACVRDTPAVGPAHLR